MSNIFSLFSNRPDDSSGGEDSTGTINLQDVNNENLDKFKSSVQELEAIELAGEEERLQKSRENALKAGRKAREDYDREYKSNN